MIEVRRYGSFESPTVVLLHGGPGGRGYMAGLACMLCDEWDVVEPLQRASGDRRLTVAQHVADLGEVLQAIPGSVPLVGSSWGAMLALTYGARHPNDVSRIVAIGPGTFDVECRKEFRRRLAKRAGPEGNRRLRELSRKLGVAQGRQEREPLFQEICEISFRFQSYAPTEETLELVGYDERGYRETWVDAMRLQDQGIQPAEFRRIRAPVLQLHGTEDPHPGRMIHDSLVQVIPHLRYREFPKCGHIPWLEKEAGPSFLAALREELRRD